MKFIIEHCDSRLYQWSFLEYEHISRVVGKNNTLFTNIKTKTVEKKLKKLGHTENRSVTLLPLINAAVLDPVSSKTLTPALAKKFCYLIVGGILGDKPMKRRTKKIITDKMRLPSFNLGKKQVPTDTAVHVAYLISKGIPLEKMAFIERVDIKINKFSSVELPFRHLVIDGKVLITPGLKEYLRKRQSF
jgi:ribosome biogenesis SPOUT family RNA methylase Rps3